MKKTVKLVEFKNREDEILRGIMTLPEHKSERAAIFMHGLERNATVEKKFRWLSDALAEKGMPSFRFDASGCGLSEGDFSRTTLEKRSQELLAALDEVVRETHSGKISFVGHSSGACLLAPQLENLGSSVDKIVFIAPALNQGQLLRYYYAIDKMADENPSIIVDWGNYKQYVDENGFLSQCRSGKNMKKNLMRPQYFLEAKTVDYSASFEKVKDKVLHIHGDRDETVPLPSLNTEFPHRIIVAGGDHDLEHPDVWNQWFPRALDFLTW